MIFYLLVYKCSKLVTRLLKNENVANNLAVICHSANYWFPELTNQAKFLLLVVAEMLNVTFYSYIL